MQEIQKGKRCHYLACLSFIHPCAALSPSPPFFVAPGLVVCSGGISHGYDPSEAYDISPEPLAKRILIRWRALSLSIQNATITSSSSLCIHASCWRRRAIHSFYCFPVALGHCLSKPVLPRSANVMSADGPRRGPIIACARCGPQCIPEHFDELQSTGFVSCLGVPSATPMSNLYLATISSKLSS